MCNVLISLYPQSKPFKKQQNSTKEEEKINLREFWKEQYQLYSNHKKIIYICIKYQVSNAGKERRCACHFKLLPVMFLSLLLPWDVNVLKKYVCTLKIFPEVSGFHMFLGKQIIHSVGHSWRHLDLLISSLGPLLSVFSGLSYVDLHRTHETVSLTQTLLYPKRTHMHSPSLPPPHLTHTH